MNMDAMTEQTLAAWLLLWILGGMGLIFFAVGLLVLIQERRKKDRCTQQTWGTVVGYRYPSGAPAPVVEYQVEGAIYRKTRQYRAVISVTSRNVFREMRGEHATEFYVDDKDIAHIRQRGGIANLRAAGEAQYPMGSTLAVYYNPVKPRQAYVERVPEKRSVVGIVFLWVGLGLAVLGVLLHLLLK